MNIFSIFKRRKKEVNELNPKSILRITQQYIPGRFKASEQYLESIEYLKEDEWGLTLQTLIEMTAGEEHSFPYDFWQNLAICADKMKMNEEAEFCRSQLLRK